MLRDRWFHAENERLGINPLRMTPIPDNPYS